MKTRRSTHSQYGFLIIDSLISISIFIIVLPAIAFFIFGFYPSKYISSLTVSSEKDMYQSDMQVLSSMQSSGMPNQVQRDFIPTVSLQDKNCDIFFSTVLEAIETHGIESLDERHIELQPIVLDHANQSLFSTYANIPQSIEQWGSSDNQSVVLIVGVNSASTSAPDLYVFNYDIDTQTASMTQQLYLGPGVIDMGVSQRLFHQKEGSILGVLERSVVTPFWILDSVQGTFSAHQVTTLDLAQAYPLTLKMHGRVFAIGTNKSLWSELVIWEINPDMQTVRIIEHINTESAVQDLYLNTSSVLITSTYSPEFYTVNLSSTTRSVLSTHASIPPKAPLLHAYDFPGQLGNGRSIAVHPYGLFLGRTVGNLELYSIIDKNLLNIKQGTKIATSLSTSTVMHWPNTMLAYTASANPNTSVRALSYMHDGKGLIALFNSETDGFRMYMQRKHEGVYSLELIASFDLPAKPTDFVCMQNQLMLSTESIVHPFTILYVRK